MKKKAYALALTALLGTGCDDATPSGTARLSVMLTDGAGTEIQQAWVQIDDVYLQGETESERVSLLEGTAYSGNLLTLANDVEALIENAVVPEGTYSQIRFVIPEACITVAGVGVFASSDAAASNCEGTRAGTLQLPSYAQSGLKVNLPGGAATIEGDQNVILLDFVVAESFGRQAGQSGRWVMHPVIAAAEFGASASVQVNVALGASAAMPAGASLADFSAVLSYQGASGPVTEPLALSDADGDGVFSTTFRYLIPDHAPFTVTLTESADGVATFESTAPASISPTSGQAATVALEVTSISGS